MYALRRSRLYALAAGCVPTVRSFTTSSARAAKPVPYGHNPATGKFYDINGFKMYTEVYGSGPPLLMIHGNNGDISSFAQNIPYFAERYQVILADSRSQGRSLDPDNSLDFERMADDFAALLDAMHIDSAYVLGWSDGGVNALQLAIRHPTKVKKLAVTGANLWNSREAFAPGIWDDAAQVYEAGLRKTYKTAQAKNDRKLFLLDWWGPRITLAQLHTIHVPALIIAGDHDYLSISHTTLICQNIPHAELWIVSHSGHATLMEHPGEFNRKVGDFFAVPFKDHPVP